jgi:ABC-type dipeptide/oligopeptide/nickel transport system ATPase subunit
MNNKLRNDITKIAQGNIQEVLQPMLDRIEALEEAMDAKFAAPEVVQMPEIERQNLNYLKEQTLEVENEYVRQNLEDKCEKEETQPELKKEVELETEVVEPAPAILSGGDDQTEEASASENYQTKDSK